MKIKISEATNEFLNYLVAKLKNHDWRYLWMLEDAGYSVWMTMEEAWGRPHQDYCSNGFDIIQEECNTFYKCSTGWDAIVGFEDDLNHTIAYGETMLIAGIRAYLISKLGDEVEFPDGLML